MHRGSLVATALRGTWRSAAEPLCLDDAELSEITPLLLAAGVGGLCWRRIHASGLGQAPPARKLLQAYRLHTLQAAVHERAFVPVLQRLRAAGIDPLLAKGWAVARLYPE